MKQSDDLGLFTKFITQDAALSEVATVPESQGTAGDGTASISAGFPPETFLPRAAGGVPPRGQDMNGFLKRLSRAIQVLQTGYVGTFNATFAAAINGYPNGAVVRGMIPGTFWVSTSENNITTPGVSGASWKSVSEGYATQAWVQMWVPLWANSRYQPLLNFTPVQQGGVEGMGSNKTCLGWSSNGSGRLHYAIDGQSKDDLVNAADLPTCVFLESRNPNNHAVSGSVAFTAQRAGFIKLDINCGNDSGSRIDSNQTHFTRQDITSYNGGCNTGLTGLFIANYIFNFEAGANVVINMTIAFQNTSANNELYATGLICYV